MEYLNRKTARPFSHKHALHITMRSHIAKGKYSLYHRPTRKWLSLYLPQLANRHRIRIYHFSNNGNHLHLVLLSKSRHSLQSFLRTLAGVVARKALGAEKGRASGLSFWSERPYSRIISWGREFTRVMEYVERNVMEARRLLTFSARNHPLPNPVRVELKRRVWLNARDRQIAAETNALLFEVAE